MDIRLSQLRMDLDELKKKQQVQKQETQKLRPKTRFRALVRAVMANRTWLEDVGEQKLGDNVKLNVLLLKKKGQKSILTLQEKAILMKNAEDRTEEEKRALNLIVRGLKCFRRYPEDVQKKLAAATYFVFYGPNRVVVRQGQHAHALYFILQGEVTISLTTMDQLFRVMVTNDVGMMVAGDMFGEVSLLHNIPRTATVTTATACELLALRREDFANVLQESLQQQWDLCKASMKRFPYFNGWNEVAIRECCILAKMITFVPNQTVLGDDQGHSSYVHFILRGQCRLVQHLIVVASSTNGSVSYRMPRPGKPLREGEKLETHFMQITLFNELQCFGLGEDLTDRRIVAVTAVECLLFPRHWIMQYNKNNTWGRVRHFLERRFPSSEQIFDVFVQHRRWEKYRQQLLRDALYRRRIPLDTSIHDVPYSIRLREKLDLLDN